jgi:hypothetical protein
MRVEAVESAPLLQGQGFSIPSVVRCGLLIFFMKLMLRFRGFAGTTKWIRRRVESVPSTTLLDLDSLKRFEHAIALAGALYPGRAMCLEQSLTLYYVLRRRGVAVKYCHGVVPHPFEAHAWIEYLGEVISDVEEHSRLFTRLPDQLP